MSKHKLFKLGAAAALSVTGVSAITSLKTVRAANFTAIKRVKISYLPGKRLNIWTKQEFILVWLFLILKLYGKKSIY